MAGKLRSAFCTRGRRSGGERGQALVEYAIVFPLQLMMTLAIIQLAQIFVAKQVVEYAAFCGARAMLVGLSEAEAQSAAFIPLSGICSSSVNDSNGVVLPGWGSRTMSLQLYQQLQASIAAESANIPAGPAGDAIRAELNNEQTQLNNNYYAAPTQYLSGYGTASDPTITTVNFQTVTQSSASTPLTGVYCTITHNYLLRVPVGNFIVSEVGGVFSTKQDYQLGQVSTLSSNATNMTTIMVNGIPQPALVLTASCVLPNPSSNTAPALPAQ
jgi:Flp pilus assembly protein TadG